MSIRPLPPLNVLKSGCVDDALAVFDTGLEHLADMTKGRAKFDKKEMLILDKNLLALKQCLDRTEELIKREHKK